MTHTEARISNERLAEPDDNDFDLARALRKYNIGTVKRLDEVIAALRSTPAEAAPVAYIQAEVLAELAKFKDAKATVSSGLLKKPFGNPVALYARPLPNPSPSDGEVSREQAIACMAVELENNDSFARRPVNALVWATRLYDVALQSSKRGQP